MHAFLKILLFTVIMVWVTALTVKEVVDAWLLFPVVLTCLCVWVGGIFYIEESSK